jgi:hypothetical protein
MEILALQAETTHPRSPFVTPLRRYGLLAA